jgi:tRNA A-37 threonylcarbamoyl transferase component Bud32
VEGVPADTFVSGLQSTEVSGNPDPPSPIRWSSAYEILEPIGRGGCGVVLKARQPGTGRIVALKRLRAGPFADGEALRRFQREAAVLARLRHPHVVQVLDVGEQDGEPFLAMEYVPGAPLSEHLRNGPLNPPTAAALVRTLANAVAAAHGAGVVHRDLKPGNILIASAAAASDAKERDLSGIGEPRIVDFGLAKLASDEVTATSTGMLLGTPAYMAPEQIAGDGDPRLADVYALGCILYECLTGQVPFRGSTHMEVLARVRAGEFARPRSLQPRIPRALEAICLRCLETDVRRRYATAGDLAEDLRCFAAGEPVAARPPGPALRAWRWVRRHPVTTVLTTCAAAVVVAGFLALGAHQTRLQKEIDRANARTVDAEQAKESAQELYKRGMEAFNRIGIQILESPDSGSDEYRLLVDKQLAESILYYQAMSEVTEDPQVLFDLANAYQVTGYVSLQRGRRDDAIGQFRSAEQILFSIIARFPPDEFWTTELALSRVRLSHALMAAPADHAEARRVSERACADLEQLWNDKPDELQSGHLAWAHRARFAALHAAGEMEQAISALHREAEVRKHMCDLAPTNTAYAKDFASVTSELQALTREIVEESQPTASSPIREFRATTQTTE